MLWKYAKMFILDLLSTVRLKKTPDSIWGGVLDPRQWSWLWLRNHTERCSWKAQREPGTGNGRVPPHKLPLRWVDNHAALVLWSWGVAAGLGLRQCWPLESAAELGKFKFNQTPSHRRHLERVLGIQGLAREKKALHSLPSAFHF